MSSKGELNEGTALEGTTISNKDINNNTSSAVPNGGALVPKSGARASSSSIRSFTEHQIEKAAQSTGSALKVVGEAAEHAIIEVTKGALDRVESSTGNGRYNINSTCSCDVCEVVHSFFFSSFFIASLAHITTFIKNKYLSIFANVLGRLSNLAITVVKTENLKHTFHAANELGQGAIARAFKHSEIDAVALRLVYLHLLSSSSTFTAIFVFVPMFFFFLSIQPSLFLLNPLSLITIRADRV
jgi:hypothetical protein